MPGAYRSRDFLLFGVWNVHNSTPVQTLLKMTRKTRSLYGNLVYYENNTRKTV